MIGEYIHALLYLYCHIAEICIHKVFQGSLTSVLSYTCKIWSSEASNYAIAKWYMYCYVFSPLESIILMINVTMISFKKYICSFHNPIFVENIILEAEFSQISTLSFLSTITNFEIEIWVCK